MNPLKSFIFNYSHSLNALLYDLLTYNCAAENQKFLGDLSSYLRCQP